MLRIEHSADEAPTYFVEFHFTGAPVQYDNAGRVTDPRIFELYRFVRDELLTLGDIRDINLSNVKSEWHDDRLEDPLAAAEPAAPPAVPHRFQHQVHILFDDVRTQPPVAYAHEALANALHAIEARDRAIDGAVHRAHKRVSLLYPELG